MNPIIKFVARPFKPLIAKITRAYIDIEKEIEWLSNQKFTQKDMNERTVEYPFALSCLNETNSFVVLDVGTGKTAWPHLLNSCGYKVSSIDNISDYWVDGMWNRHWRVIDDNICEPRIKGPFDAITCLSVLEHIKNHKEAMRQMATLIRPGGSLILTVPFNSENYHSDVYRDPRASYGKNFPFVAQVYSKDQLNGWLSDNNLELIEDKYFEVFTGEYWTFGNRLPHPRRTTKESPHHLACFLFKRKIF